MNKRNVTLLIVLILLVGVAIFVFKDWFKARPIQISYTVRPVARSQGATSAGSGLLAGKPAYTIMFGFNQPLELKSVKVYELQEVLTNKYPLPIWNLTSESNSPPVNAITYGGRIRGLRPEVKGAIPDELKPGATYRLALETTDQKAGRDFQIPR